MKQQILRKSMLAATISAMGVSPVIYAYEQSPTAAPIVGDNNFYGGDSSLIEPISIPEISGQVFPRRTQVNQAVDVKHIQQNMTQSSNMNRNIIDQGDIENLFDSGVAKFNDAKDLITLSLGADVATANVEFIEMTQKQPMVFASFDPTNSIGTIVMVSSHRNSDGSAELYYNYISPNYFEPKSAGGNLSQQEYNSMMGQIGQNPAQDNKPTDGSAKYQHTFASVTEMGMLTFAGLIMQQEGATLGFYTRYDPSVRNWETKSGNMFKKTITYHVEASLTPDWKVLLPKGSGSSDTNLVGGSQPFFSLPDGTLVSSGIQVIDAENYASSLDLGKFVIRYDNKKESSFTGLAMAAFAFAITALTFGAGAFLGVAALSSVGPLTAGAIAGGVIGGVSLMSGTLTDPVSSGFINITAVTDEKSFDSYGDFGEKWKNTVRDKIALGPLNSDRNYDTGKTAGDIDPVAVHQREIVGRWDNLVDPEFEEAQATGKINGLTPVDTDTMFDNKYDNPDFGKKYNYSYPNYGGGGEN